MRKFTSYIILSVCILLGIIMTGCANSKDTFALVTDSEIFQTIPIMSGEKLAFSDVADVGAGNYMITASDTTLSEYENYLVDLEKAGYSKHVDNGEEGLEGYIYTAHYLKDDMLVVASYFSKTKETTITVCEQAVLSEHLFYKDEYVKDNIEGAKTKLTMPELYRGGQSFVFQLKNGHFIIHDGGYEDDLPYLLDYMDSLVEPGEKPIVDAWFVSHAHNDHMGPFIQLQKEPEYINRLYVEEVYFTAPSVEAQTGNIAQYDRAEVLVFYAETVPSTLKSTDGSAPEVIRFRPGERYYFNDITVDVAFTCDLLPHTAWKTWNATSVVLMFTIEEQKMLLTADMDWECQKVLLDVFDDDYFEMKIYQAPHHGGNVYNEFSSHLKTDVVLYPSYDVDRYRKTTLLDRVVQNRYLQGIAEEALGWKEGGVVLTFPYEAETYERLPLIDWIYHDEEPTNR